MSIKLKFNKFYSAVYIFNLKWINFCHTDILFALIYNKILLINYINIVSV